MFKIRCFIHGTRNEDMTRSLASTMSISVLNKPCTPDDRLPSWAKINQTTVYHVFETPHTFLVLFDYLQSCIRPLFSQDWPNGDCGYIPFWPGNSYRLPVTHILLFTCFFEGLDFGFAASPCRTSNIRLFPRNFSTGKCAATHPTINKHQLNKTL